MIFKPKMTNGAEMITKRLQLATKLVKVAKMKEVFYNKANKSGQG